MDDVMRAYLGLGSNVGDRQANIDEAIRRLGATEGLRVTKVSSMYDTEPVGGPPQPNYLNAACEVETDLSPHELLRTALAVEDAMGRRREVHWGPRNIDIDVLICGEVVINDDELTVPHPRLPEREFVLRPLAEIAPEVRHPVKKREIRVLLGAVQGPLKRKRVSRKRKKKTQK